ncbi:hypothetical protein Agub_g6466, partial [Astrephomene gubernaculifera]
WGWASGLSVLRLQGLELAGLELRPEDVAAVAEHLGTLEDLRLDCRYPLPSLPCLAHLRRLQHLLLDVSFWHQHQAQQQLREDSPPPQQQQQPQQQQEDEGRQSGDPTGPTPAASAPVPPAAAAASAVRTPSDALVRLCAAAPGCLRNVYLAPYAASYGSPPVRTCVLQALDAVERALPRVACGELRLWLNG